MISPQWPTGIGGKMGSAQPTLSCAAHRSSRLAKPTGAVDRLVPLVFATADNRVDTTEGHSARVPIVEALLPIGGLLTAQDLTSW